MLHLHLIAMVALGTVFITGLGIFFSRPITLRLALRQARAMQEKVDFHSLSVDVDGDLQWLGLIIDCYLEDAVSRLAELTIAVSQRQRDVIARIAHALRGSVANFSVGATYTICAALESHAQTGTWGEISTIHAQLIRCERSLTGCLAALRNRCV